MKKHSLYTLLSVLSCAGLMVIVVMLYYLLLEQAIKNYFNTDKSLKHISEVDSGYGISPENPISLEECTPNAQKVIEKFKPGKIYQCFCNTS
jgi:hypothetical protein